MWAIDYFYGAFQAAQADFLTIHGPCERETLIKAFQKFSGSTGIWTPDPRISSPSCYPWTTAPFYIHIHYIQVNQFEFEQ